MKHFPPVAEVLAGLEPLDLGMMREEHYNGNNVQLKTLWLPGI
jgi:hypothetical protein